MEKGSLYHLANLMLAFSSDYFVMSASNSASAASMYQHRQVVTSWSGHAIEFENAVSVSVILAVITNLLMISFYDDSSVF